MFIQTEVTPDPARLKFLPGREVLAQGILDLHDKTEAAVSPLAERLLAIPNVAAVLLGRDSITVTRVGGDWQQLKPSIFGVIMEHFMSGAPILRGEGASGGRDLVEGDNGISGQIWEALRKVIDPELGYNIVDLGLVYCATLGEGGAVTVSMTTTTPGCPATNYLKAGAREAASSVEGVASVDVQLTYEPRWTPEMMTAEAKAHLGIRDGGGW